MLLDRKTGLINRELVCEDQQHLERKRIGHFAHEAEKIGEDFENESTEPELTPNKTWQARKNNQMKSQNIQFSNFGV